ncbi:MAG: T3SS (YopN, CesT) and YbjN peptide-binding chaperone 1 [Microthrixaceae bacterium]
MTDFEAVWELVHDTLAERFDAHVTDDNFRFDRTKFAVPTGSSTLFVKVAQRRRSQPVIVKIWSWLLTSAKPSPELFEYLAFSGERFDVGHLHATPGGPEPGARVNVTFTHNFLGEHLDAESFTAVLRLMMDAADELDDELQDLFGGFRWTD